MAIYSIHEDNMPKLIEKLKKIESKCIKYGCSFSFAEVGEEYKNVNHDVADSHEKVTVKTTLERFVIVEVEGKAIINDWQFVATLEHTENGNIIRNATSIELPVKYLTVKPICEHCNSNRQRKDTYIIRNIITNELKQVGKSCLRDYTNGMNAEMVASYLSYFEYLTELNNHESLGGFTRHYIDINNYLLNVAEAIRNYGFISKQKAYEQNKEPTTSKVNMLMYDTSKYAKEERKKINYNPEREENKKLVTDALNWIKTQETNGGYLHNLKMVCLKDYAEFRDCGLLASLLPAYYKALETEKQRLEREAKQANKKESQYIGNIGEKITIQATIKYITSYETQYGITRIYKLTDNDGNVLVWKTSTTIEESETLKTITATIKAHSEYNGEKQTEILRVKVK